MPAGERQQTAPQRAGRSGLGLDAAAVGVAGVLVAAAAVVGAWLNDHGARSQVWSAAAPLFGKMSPHVGLGTAAAVVVAVAVVAWGPTLAQRLSWRSSLAAGYAAAVAWTFSLAMVDGWQRGFAGRLTSRFEYLSEVPGVSDTGVMLREFTDRILVGSPDNWAVHVSGHPPGALLTFVWLDRLGLSGGAAASTACVLIGCLAAVAVPVAVRALGDEQAARRVLPFAVLFPGAVWVGASADGLFAGVTATGLAVLALAVRARGPRRWVLAGAAGLVLGFAVYLSYGMVLAGLIALATISAKPSGGSGGRPPGDVTAQGRAWDVLAVSVAGALAVTGAFALAGFWWLDGYQLVVERYYQDLGATRAYGYWVWANLAAQVLVIGPAVVAGLRRFGHAVVRPELRSAAAWLLLASAALVAILVADLSGLSKAETERIWLPFAVWLLPMAALLPQRHARGWLAAQALTALAVNHLVLTAW